MARKPETSKPANTPAPATEKPEIIDFKSAKPMPAWVRDVIDAHIAIEAEDARRAGSVGFMTRAMVLATMPYRDPKQDLFVRQNGDFRLRIIAGHEGGIPYGVYPRLLLSWITTEAMRTNSSEIELGDSLAAFLRNVLDIRGRGGGARGSGARVFEQMARTFGAVITASYSGSLASRGFQLRNVVIAEEVNISPHDVKRFRNLTAEDPPALEAPAGGALSSDDLWVPQARDEAGRWKSVVKLNQKFFAECIENPVPIDLRAFKALRGSAMAMDIYAWLTYRMAYTRKATRPIPWEMLQMQFGTSLPNDDQGKRDFKKAFIKNLKLVATVYPEAKVDVRDNGLVLYPSPTHIPSIVQGGAKQRLLFGSGD